MLATDPSLASTAFVAALGRTSQFAFAPAGRIGSSGRNNFRSPRFHNSDVPLVKRIAIAERLKLGYRLELFIALNHANFDNPNNVYSTPNSFGRITALVNGSSGSCARVMQMALRLDF